MSSFLKTLKANRAFCKSPYFAFVCFILLLPCRALAQTLQQDTTRVLRLDSVANTLMKMPDSALQYVEQGLSLARKIAYKKGIAQLTNDRAIVYMEKDDHPGALKEFTKAAKLFRILHINVELGRVYKDMALINLYDAKHKEAMSLVLKALNLFEANHAIMDIPVCYSIIGYIHVQQGDLKEGLENHRKSYDVAITLLQQGKTENAAEKKRSVAALLEACRNMANVYTRMGNYDSAMVYLNKGLEYSKDAQFLSARIKLLISVANVYEKRKDFGNEVKVLRTALSLAVNNKMYYNMAIIYANLAGVSNNGATGIRYYDTALNLARDSVADITLVKDILQEKSSYAEEHGNYKEALRATKDYHNINDSIFSVEKAAAIKDLESTNQLDKNEVKMQQMLLKELKNKQVIIAISFLVLALIITLATTMWYQGKLKKLNKKMVEQQKELVELNNTKDKVFSVISHDLKAPLTAISGMLYLMKEGALAPDEIDYFVDNIAHKNENSLEIMNKLLAWGSFEMRQEDVQKTFFAKEELKSTLKLTTDRATEKNVVFTESIDAGMQLHANPYHFDFIIRNLLQNAVKFTPTGGIVLLACRQDSERTVFSITDNGCGISDDMVQKLFQSAVESSYGTEGEKGIGIGLMLVKKYADANGHKLRVSSNEGEGTTFYYEL